MQNKQTIHIHWFFFLTTILLSIMLAWEGYTYAKLPEKSILQAFYNIGLFKDITISYDPGKGIWHIVGWAGSGLMGLMMFYSLRKRFEFMSGFGRLETWLNVHICFGLLGTVLIVAHTTLKVGGIVSISFWSMILTTLSGIIGRYIYVQIPRGIAGNELKVEEINQAISVGNSVLKKYPAINRVIANMIEKQEIIGYGVKKVNIFSAVILLIKGDLINMKVKRQLKAILRAHSEIPFDSKRRLLFFCSEKIKLIKKLNLLAASQRIFHCWHVIHLPIAIIMFLIMFLHIFISYVFKVY